MTKIKPKVIRQAFILLLIICVCGVITYQLIPYLSGILGALTLYVLLHNTMNKLINKGYNKTFSALILIALSFICILIPVISLGIMITSKVEYIVANYENVIDALQIQLQVLESYLDIDINLNINKSNISGWLSQRLQYLAGSTFTISISIFIMYFILYYMLTKMSLFKTSLLTYIPIKKVNLKVIGTQAYKRVKANAVGIPLVALSQGVVALLGFLVFKVPNPLFWAAVVTLGSVIPFVGSALGTFPVFLLSLSNGNTFMAWCILAYGIVVIGATDNVFRLLILKRLNNVHPLVTLIGVVVGVPLFGFIGVIFGPLLISLFLSIMHIYNAEFHLKK